MCCPPTKAMCDHLEETGHCLMCNDTELYGMLPCPFCCEQEAGTALKFIVIPGMVVGLLGLAGIGFLVIRELVS